MADQPDKPDKPAPADRADSSSDRRQSPRFPTRSLVEVRLPSWDALRGVYMTNISIGGMRLSLGARTTIGVSVDIILTLPNGERVHLPGKVANLGPGATGDIGVKFEGLLPKTRQEIESYINSMQAGGPRERKTTAIPTGTLIKKT